jgi:hypothetical protein
MRDIPAVLLEYAQGEGVTVEDDLSPRRTVGPPRDHVKESSLTTT